MKEEDELRFEKLCDGFFEESLTGEEKRCFEKWLLESEEARRAYLWQSSLRSSLRHYASEAQSVGEPAEHVLEEPREDGPKIHYFEVLKWAVSLAIAFLLGALIWERTGMDYDASGAAPEIEESTYEGMAVLMQAHDVVWPEGGRLYKNGDSIPAGSFKMDAGLVQLEFYSGATVVLEGAADLEILSEEKAFCRKGRVTVAVSPHAKGFLIATPDVEFVDLGTEFGLEVVPGEPSELHVFSGEVEVYESGSVDSKAPLHVLETGDAAAFASASVAANIELDGSFRDAEHLASLANRMDRIRFDAWMDMSQILAQREDIVRYFPFYRTPEWERDLENASELGALEKNGAIVGCRWEEGRWVQKSALRFDNPSDRVRFNVPGAFESVSFAAWIKVESLKNIYNGLFMTDTFEPGNPHWQIDDKGRLILGIKRMYREEETSFQFVLFSPSVITPDVYGKWVHVASTYDVASSQIKHYLNGRLIAELQEDGAADTKVLVGTGEIGNWGLSRKEKRHIRNFDGAIDELLFCSSVLSQEEILDIYRKGEASTDAIRIPMFATNEYQ